MMSYLCFKILINKVCVIFFYNKIKPSATYIINLISKYTFSWVLFNLLLPSNNYSPRKSLYNLQTFCFSKIKLLVQTEN